ncbi:uncharacterized protein LOC134272366, partial [Saccostrea cucullata]|uniref:uncharacterized protein LOC134272366 n=1 Tax=Saccostrea cuccullata TaxID=36930 RepID=UPI002ED5A5FC
MVVGTDGYILLVLGPYLADGKDNDSAILNSVILNNVDEVQSSIEKEDLLVVDRGFRDSLDFFDKLGIKHEMPGYLSRRCKQHTTEEANHSRCVTKVRWVVESANGRIKTWKALDQVVPNTQVKWIGDYVRIVSAIVNAFRPPLISNSDDDIALANEMKQLSRKSNELRERVERENLSSKRAIWVKLPSVVFRVMNRKIFVEYVKKVSEEKQASIQSLNLNSLLGSFLIGRKKYSSEVPEILALSQTKKSILVSILISESYSLSLSTTWEEISKKLQSAFPLLKCDSKTLDSDITELKDISKVLNKENNSVSFISDDVRHQVMSYFVRNCLITDEDYKNYIKLSSVDSLLEYVRPWWYMVYIELKKCLFLPETLEDSFFQRLGLDVLRHPMINRFEECDEETTKTFREKVKDKFNVPEEIFNWKYDARYRYIECAKRGTKTVHRARAMIVGCAGAGKTTLLKRLEKLGLEELLKVRSTVGLEVHEDMFELDEDSSLRALSDSTDKNDKQILSVVDFGGQCAYYASHQVYLSRRAFYLLVIDMSKFFTEKVDENKCEQQGTMFADWTYG